MQHLEPELISLLALDDTVGNQSDRDHLRRCSQCADEYQALRRAVEAVKADPEPTLEPPGPAVWVTIHRELALSPELAADPLQGRPETTPSGRRPSRTASSRGVSAKPKASRRLPAGPPSSRRLSSRNLPAWLAAAAAVAIIAAIGVSWGVTRNAATLAQAQLEPLEQYAATGTARVVEANGTPNRNENPLRLRITSRTK